MIADEIPSDITKVAMATSRMVKPAVRRLTGPLPRRFSSQDVGELLNRMLGEYQSIPC